MAMPQTTGTGSFYPLVSHLLVQADSKESPEFFNSVLNAFKELQSQPIGARLIQKIEKKGFSVQISPGATTKIDAKTLNCIYQGRGAATTIQVALTGEKSEDLSRLAHVLIHAYHSAYGKIQSGRALNLCSNVVDTEEVYTVSGLPDKASSTGWNYTAKIRKKPQITLNNIRQEHGLEPLICEEAIKIIRPPVENRRRHLNPEQAAIQSVALRALYNLRQTMRRGPEIEFVAAGNMHK